MNFCKLLACTICVILEKDENTILMDEKCYSDAPETCIQQKKDASNHFRNFKTTFCCDSNILII